MAHEAICYVVRDITGENQLSVRFTVREHARQFADNCAMPVRLWRIISKRRFSDGSPVPKREPTSGQTT